MTPDERAARLAQLAADVRAAEARGDGWIAGELWRSYELVRNAGRDPDDLLAEGIALSVVALDLVGRAEHPAVAAPTDAPPE